MSEQDDKNLATIRKQHDEWEAMLSPDEPSGIGPDDYRDRASEANAEIGWLLMKHYSHLKEIAELTAERDEARAPPSRNGPRSRW